MPTIMEYRSAGERGISKIILDGKDVAGNLPHGLTYNLHSFSSGGHYGTVHTQDGWEGGSVFVNCHNPTTTIVVSGDHFEPPQLKSSLEIQFSWQEN